VFSKRKVRVKDLLESDSDQSLLEPLLLVFAGVLYGFQVLSDYQHLQLLLAIGPDYPSHLINYLLQLGMIQTLILLNIVMLTVLLLSAGAIYFGKRRLAGLLVILSSLVTIPLFIIFLDWTTKFGYLSPLTVEKLLTYAFSITLGLSAAINALRPPHTPPSRLHEEII